jgi:hypothetical protein
MRYKYVLHLECKTRLPTRATKMITKQVSFRNFGYEYNKTFPSFQLLNCKELLANKRVRVPTYTRISSVQNTVLEIVKSLQQ